MGIDPERWPQRVRCWPLRHTTYENDPAALARLIGWELQTEGVWEKRPLLEFVSTPWTGASTGLRTTPIRRTISCWEETAQ